MSGDEIRNIRREIKKSIGLTIEYENPYFQLLKRGLVYIFHLCLMFIIGSYSV